MRPESWKTLSLATAVQVLSESVFFAQGILASEQISNEPPGQKDTDWVTICVPLFYAATRNISESCWRWIFGGYGDRMTASLGAAIITVSVVAASCQDDVVGNVGFVILGGVGMGLVRLQMKLIKSNSGDSEYPLWGAGVFGIGLSLWPLLTCLFVRSLGPRYTMVILAGITLHSLPLAIFAHPTGNGRVKLQRNHSQNRHTGVTPARPPTTSPNTNLIQKQEVRFAYQMSELDYYRVRPSYYVDVLPGIPEESECESDCEKERENQRIIPEVTKTSFDSEKINVRQSIQKDGRKKRSLEIERAERLAVHGPRIEPKPFVYTLFVATILLRLGDELILTIAISLLPIFAGFFLPELRIQEKAFLMSLCGFSRILAEFPILVVYKDSKKAKVGLLFGPLLAAVGLYFSWNSESLDALTLASFGTGIGSGIASATLQIFAPRESPSVSDFANIVIGVFLLGIVPLARILILGHAIKGCLLLGAVLYVAAAITSAFSLQKTV
ncbi:uncharacterized protein LOC105693109 isoform X1 [Athalia rosae]|uniref:uncharacterized protein LOC105693109 isoform X1 n=2 Tax=Athalia rosae TaxID=37344 RepID=UPI0020332902|nr:uncharacterized protein LOC105693109 isoform X1 [Athalia rosae]